MKITLLPNGINKLSVILKGLLVKTSKMKKAKVKIKAQKIPKNSMHIIKHTITPAMFPSQDLSLFHLILFLPNLIPI